MRHEDVGVSICGEHSQEVAEIAAHESKCEPVMNERCARHGLYLIGASRGRGIRAPHDHLVTAESQALRQVVRDALHTAALQPRLLKAGLRQAEAQHGNLHAAFRLSSDSTVRPSAAICVCGSHSSAARALPKSPSRRRN